MGLAGETCLKTAYTSPLKYFLSDSVKHKKRVHSLDFVGAFLKVVVNNRIFVNLDIRYADYFS